MLINAFPWSTPPTNSKPTNAYYYKLEPLNLNRIFAF